MRLTLATHAPPRNETAKNKLFSGTWSGCMTLGGMAVCDRRARWAPS